MLLGARVPLPAPQVGGARGRVMLTENPTFRGAKLVNCLFQLAQGIRTGDGEGKAHHLTDSKIRMPLRAI